MYIQLIQIWTLAFYLQVRLLYRKIIYFYMTNRVYQHETCNSSQQQGQRERLRDVKYLTLILKSSICFAIKELVIGDNKI